MTVRTRAGYFAKKPTQPVPTQTAADVIR